MVYIVNYYLDLNQCLLLDDNRVENICRSKKSYCFDNNVFNKELIIP